MTAVAYFAAKEFCYSLEDVIWNMPLVQILLLVRQHSWMNDNSQMTLSDIEKIDSGADWQKLVEENRRQLELKIGK